MQDPKKTQEAIESEEQKLRAKQQSLMNFVMLAAKDLAQAKIYYEKSVQTKSHMVDAKSALDSATENYNLFKEQADELNKLLKPYDEVNAFNKQLTVLRDQKNQLQNEIAELTSTAKNIGERKNSGPSIQSGQSTRKDSLLTTTEAERKRTLPQSIISLVSSKPNEKEKTVISEKIKEKEEAKQNIEKAIRELEHKRFLITIQNADNNKLTFEKTMLLNEQKKMNKDLETNPSLLKDVIYAEKAKLLSDKIQTISEIQVARSKQTTPKEDVKIPPPKHN